MKRSLYLFVSDIDDCIKNIEDFSKGLSKNNFLNDKLRQSAIVRQLEIIGEAAKNIPEIFREQYPEIPWKKIAGLRDVITHAYFNIDIDITWDIIKKDLPALKKHITKIKNILKKKEKWTINLLRNYLKIIRMKLNSSIDKQINLLEYKPKWTQ